MGYFRHISDENIAFAFQGRTWGSVSRLASEWYRTVNQRHYDYNPVSWKGANYKPFEEKIAEDAMYRIVQLTTSNDLAIEGNP